MTAKKFLGNVPLDPEDSDYQRKYRLYLYQYSLILSDNGLDTYWQVKHTYLARRSTVIMKAVPLG